MKHSMVELICASSNKSKYRELTELLPSDFFSLRVAPDALSVHEDGKTFFENAQKKAQAYYKAFSRPILSDDSGLSVESLEGELGVDTANFGGRDLTDKQRADKLLERMDGETNRKAHMICVLCFYLHPNELFFFEGRMEGSIAHAYLGKEGFGYDPIFIPSKHSGEQTLGTLPEWKRQHSHRARACREASIFFQSY